ncbi:Hypothetical predicted protein, partial [Pelobates cultripes]
NILFAVQHTDSIYLCQCFQHWRFAHAPIIDRLSQPGTLERICVPLCPAHFRVRHFEAHDAARASIPCLMDLS